MDEHDARGSSSSSGMIERSILEGIIGAFLRERRKTRGIIRVVDGSCKENLQLVMVL